MRILLDNSPKKGEAKGDPTAWIDAITQETHGWAQHIIAYTEPAVAYLKKPGNEMTDTGLAYVMEQGRENRRIYYEDRLDGVDNDDILRLVKIFRNAQEHVPQKELLEKLGEAVFAQVVSQGVLYRKNGFYTIPIPAQILDGTRCAYP